MSFFSSRRQPDSDDEPIRAPAESPPIRSPLGGQPVGFETVLGTNIEMEGILRSSGNTRIDGKFSGTLEITGNILIGEAARIEADINARNISIAGTVRGNVNGKKVQLLRTARVWGDIHATALATEEGAFIDGKITMEQPAEDANAEGDLMMTPAQETHTAAENETPAALIQPENEANEEGSDDD